MFKIKKQVLVLPIFLLMNVASIKITLHSLKKVLYIYYLLSFQKNPYKNQALIDLSNKVNTITLIYVAKLGQKIQKTDIRA